MGNNKKRAKHAAGPAGRAAEPAPLKGAAIRDERAGGTGGGRNKAVVLVVAGLVVVAAAALILLRGGRGPRGGGSGRSAGLNVLIITLDTTRADHLGCYGYAGASTPNLDALAAGGVRFKTAYCPAPLTLTSHCSIMTGREPFHHGVHNNGSYVLPAGETTLAEILKGQGYRTAAFTASFSVNSRFGLNQGFDVYDDNFRLNGEGQTANPEERPAGEVFDVFSAWFARLSGDEPFFAWVHFYDPHMPYDPPAPYKSRFAAHPYDGEIAYVDEKVGGILRLLKERGLAGRTLIVVSGDHGEGFGEKVEEGHGIFIYDNTLRVPLIFNGAGLPAGLAPTVRVRLIDITPTILEILGLAEPAGVDGKSLMPVIKGRETADRDVHLESFYPRESWGWSELTGFVSGRWKYIQAPRPELYDLEADPGEEHDVAAGNPAVVKDMRDRLAGTLAAAAGADSSKRKLSSTEEERLRSLGYVQFGGGNRTGALPDPKDKVEVLKLFQDARKREMAGDLAGTERLGRELLKRKPGISDSYSTLASVQMKRKETDAALETLKAGLRVLPDSDILLVALGKDCLALGRLPEALDAANRALAANPQCTDALMVSILIHERQGHIREAIDCQEKALAIDPRNEFFRMTYARNLASAGRLDDAVRIYASLTMDFPNNAAYFRNLGTVYAMKNDDDRTIECLEKSILLGPNPRAYFNLAAAYLNKGRTADAMKALGSYLADTKGENEASIREARDMYDRLRAHVR